MLLNEDLTRIVNRHAENIFYRSAELFNPALKPRTVFFYQIESVLVYRAVGNYHVHKPVGWTGNAKVGLIGLTVGVFRKDRHLPVFLQNGIVDFL